MSSSTDTFLLTAKPVYAVTCWLDDANVYIEIPSKGDAPPYVQKFELCEAGLHKALHIMRQGYLAAKPPVPQLRKTRGPSRHPSIYTDEQRDAALRALRKVTK